MAKIHVGCAGWDYKDWIGPFYPKTLEKYRHLEYYTRYFDLTEINSTFYNLPTKDTVYKWATRVPNTFRYIIKVWQNITHELDDQEIDSRIAQFFYRMKPLEEKVLAFLFQFPPWFKYSKDNLYKLNYLKNEIPFQQNIKYVFELRDNSWFDPNIITNFIDESNKILGTTYMPRISPYYFPNQKNYYIRLIGDRELTVFNRIQREQKESMANLKLNLENLIKHVNIYEIFIIVNNHFTGFAPEMANRIKKMFDLPIKQFNKQKMLSDFL
ncbi:MAG: DUF72 domain-containing protein [Promethearchaeota archaeon]